MVNFKFLALCASLAAAQVLASTSCSTPAFLAQDPEQGADQLIGTSSRTPAFLAQEQGTDWLIAYDRNFNEIARYYGPDNLTTIAVPKPTIGGQCTSLTANELKTLSAWPVLEARAREYWGTGSYNLVLNPSESPDSNAYTCVSTGIVQIRLVGSPSCTSTTASTSGTLVGASGSVTLSIASGYESTGSYSVTRSSTLAIGFEASMTVGIPGLGEAGASITTTTSFTNQVGRSFGTTTSNQIIQSIVLNAPAGSTCKLSYTTETCHQSSNGQVAFIANGWVWFNFNSPTQGHYKWALNMNAVTTEAQRSSYTDFTGAINGHSNGNYHGVCN